jgi:nucleoside-diphosphate-sugar epimerase
VYGNSSSASLNEESRLNPNLAGPRSYYPLAKLAGESISMSREDIRSVVLRIFHSFGPGVREGDGRSFADLLWGAHKYRELELFSSGSQVRSFLDSRDLSRAVAMTAKNPDATGIYNLGSDQGITIIGFAERVAALTGSKIIFRTLNDTQIQLSNLERLVPDTNKLRSLGWTPTISLDNTVLDTLKSFPQ